MGFGLPKKMFLGGPADNYHSVAISVGNKSVVLLIHGVCDVSKKAKGYWICSEKLCEACSLKLAEKFELAPLLGSFQHICMYCFHFLNLLKNSNFNL